jgi:hypothetical protein
MVPVSDPVKLATSPPDPPATSGMIVAELVAVNVAASVPAEAGTIVWGTSLPVKVPYRPPAAWYAGT